MLTSHVSLFPICSPALVKKLKGIAITLCYPLYIYRCIHYIYHYMLYMQDMPGHGQPNPLVPVKHFAEICPWTTKVIGACVNTCIYMYNSFYMHIRLFLSSKGLCTRGFLIFAYGNLLRVLADFSDFLKHVRGVGFPFKKCAIPLEIN